MLLFEIFISNKAKELFVCVDKAYFLFAIVISDTSESQKRQFSQLITSSSSIQGTMTQILFKTEQTDKHKDRPHVSCITVFSV